jgi:hypothetical protein
MRISKDMSASVQVSRGDVADRKLGADPVSGDLSFSNEASGLFEEISGSTRASLVDFRSADVPV